MPVTGTRLPLFRIRSRGRGCSRLCPWYLDTSLRWERGGQPPGRRGPGVAAAHSAKPTGRPGSSPQASGAARVVDAHSPG